MFVWFGWCGFVVVECEVMGLSPLVLFSFGEFENELVAYPLILWALYFFFCREWDKVVVLGWFGFLFWPWAYYLSFVQRVFSPVLEMNLFHGLLDAWFLLDCSLSSHERDKTGIVGEGEDLCAQW